MYQLHWVLGTVQTFITWTFCWLKIPKSLVQDASEPTGKMECYNPMGSMYGIVTYIWLIFVVNVGKYTIHGSYGNVTRGLNTTLLCSRFYIHRSRPYSSGWSLSWCIKICSIFALLREGTLQTWPGPSDCWNIYHNIPRYTDLHWGIMISSQPWFYWLRLPWLLCLNPEDWWVSEVLGRTGPGNLAILGGSAQLVSS